MYAPGRASPSCYFLLQPEAAATLPHKWAHGAHTYAIAADQDISLAIATATAARTGFD